MKCILHETTLSDDLRPTDVHTFYCLFPASSPTRVEPPSGGGGAATKAVTCNELRPLPYQARASLCVVLQRDNPNVAVEQHH